MAIYRILQNSAFEPEDVERMTAAYEAALRELQLADRSDPLTDIIARHVIEIAQTGQNDSDEICRQVLARLKG